MPSTYTLISSNVLSSSAASVTFSAIPSTFTDLVLRLSLRHDDVNPTALYKINFNNDSTSIYSWTRLRGNGSATAGSTTPNTTYVYGGIIDANSATANTFASVEIYVPSYTVNQNRPVSVISSQENNDVNATTDAIAGLYRSTTAVSRIDLGTVSGNFMAGSSFYLYGIKNS